MRVLFGLMLGVLVLALAFWAYQENYRTRAAIAEMRALQAEIARLGEERAVLRAEWAWLNRPERLRELVGLNFPRLGLLPMTPDHFGRIDQIAYPRPPAAAMLARPGSGADQSDRADGLHDE